MSNIKTLKPFKKGKDPRRNLKGRPVGSISITKRIKKELVKIPEGSKETYADLMVKRILLKAIKGDDIQILKLVWNYVDGLPLNKTDITSESKPIVLKFDKAFKESEQTNKRQ